MIQPVLKELFEGKKGTNNKDILDYFLKNEKVCPYDIRDDLGIAYGTIHGRIDSLESQGIIKKVGEEPSDRGLSRFLYSLTNYGLTLSALTIESTDQNVRTLGRPALEKCRKILQQYYQNFLELYELVPSENDSSFFKHFSQNLITNETILSILKFFGSYPLDGESQAFLTFRRMIDIGLILRGSKQQYIQMMWDIEGVNTWSFDIFAQLALKRKDFQELYRKIEKTDKRLFDHLKSNYYKELTEFLSEAVDEKIAEKLVDTPIIKGLSKEHASRGIYAHISKKPLREVVIEAERNFEPHIGKKWIPSISILVVHEGRLCIVASKPDEINSEWKRYSDLYHPNNEGNFVLLRNYKGGNS